MGDGRAWLGPVLREYVVSEAMHALGIPTTRSLAVVTTGERVLRESVLPGAILTRVAASHIRVGTFEYLRAIDTIEGLRRLADTTIERHYPEVAEADHPYRALLQAAADRQASLVARWMHVGFIHGVMNTDNMALSGETIDYGPCAFMDQFDPATVFSSIDRYGRYAFGNQPRIAVWNLARFAETLLPLFHPNTEDAVTLAEETLSRFGETFQTAWLAGMRQKLGLLNEEPEDLELIQSLLDWMQAQKADYTNTFRALSSESLPDDVAFQEPAFRDWQARWQARLTRQAEPIEEARTRMRAVNPAVIPRNHRVEAALKAASDRGDLSLVHRLLEILARPFDDHPEAAEYRTPPLPDERVTQTFCGT